MVDYVKIIAGLLKKDSKIFLSSFDFDQKERSSLMPLATAPEEINVCYSSEFLIKPMRSIDANTTAETYRGMMRSEPPAHAVDYKKLKHFSWNFHLLIKK